MKHKLYIIGFILIILYLILLIPESDNTIEIISSVKIIAKPFTWNQDAYWDSLEAQYLEARAAGCQNLIPVKDSLFKCADSLVTLIGKKSFQPVAKVFSDLETTIFILAPIVGACPDWLSQYIRLASKLRSVVKRQSENWDMNSFDARHTLYRLLYGSRWATEEIILQAPDSFAIDPFIPGIDEPSITSSAEILGLKIHSGDILVSRGGAPTSALIARGNDFAGNFSHIALVYVVPSTNAIKIIESHIERGITTSSVDDYLKDTKLRIMVLRLKSDLPQMVDDPMLPHKAAGFMFYTASTRHIPYDFEMDASDSSKLFCSEVASFAYHKFGVRLWMGMSHISSPGLRNWLAYFGVRYFETQEPSDLEYDPQLNVVAEWRDLETLRQDHYDNAVTEVMLEEAERGMKLEYDWYLLPVARVLKTYSYILNLFGMIGPVPEGMNATAALRNDWYSKMHSTKKEKLEQTAYNFKMLNGYEPPYWKLVEMMRQE